MKLQTFILLLSTTAVAQANPPSFESIVREIASNNPELAVEAQKANLGIAEISTENNLQDPEVEFTSVWGQKGVGNKWDLSVSQSFEWPGVYGSRNKEKELTTEAAAYLIKSKESEIHNRIRQSLIDLINARQLVELNAAALRNLDSLYKYYDKALDLGEISRLDVNKIKLERISVSRQLADASVLLTDATDRLRQLNGGKSCENLTKGLTRFPSSPLRPAESYLAEAQSVNPDLKYNNKVNDIFLQKEKTLKLSRWPGLKIGYTHEYEIGDHFNGFTVGLTLPFFSNRKKQAVIEKQKSLLHAENNKLMVDQSTQILADHAKARRLMEEIQLYRPLIESKEAEELLGKALDARHISVLTYIQEMNYYLEARADYIDLLYQYNLLLVQLERYSAQ